MVISKTSSTHTAQGIYVEHLKKDKQMSNNKQSSVEFLTIQLIKNGIITNDDLQQAKAMHKEEIRKTINDTQESFWGVNYQSFDDYYNETFGE